MATRHTPGISSPVGCPVGADPLGGALLERPRGVLGERRQPLGQGPGQGGRPLPPLVDRCGVVRHRELADLDVGQARSRQHGSQLVGVRQGERVGDARRGSRDAQLLADGVEDDAQPGIALARAPDRDRRPAARTEDAPDLAGCGGRIRDEHEPLPAQHDIERGVRLVDVLDVEHARRDVQEAAVRGLAGGDRRHLGREVGDDDLAAGSDERGGVESRPAGSAGQFEDALAGARPGQVEHPLGDMRAAAVDVAQVGGPRSGHAGPHLVQLGPERIAGGGDGNAHGSCPFVLTTCRE